MEKSQIWDFFVACGWEPDRWGHLQKSVARSGNCRTFRLKFQAKSVRFEVKGERNWYRLTSGFYGKIFTRADGALVLGSKVFKSPEQLAAMRAKQ